MVDILSIASCSGFDTIGLINGFSSARTVIFIRVSFSSTCFNCIQRNRGTGEFVVVNLIVLFGSRSTI